MRAPLRTAVAGLALALLAAQYPLFGAPSQSPPASARKELTARWAAGTYHLGEPVPLQVQVQLPTGVGFNVKDV